MTLSLSQTRGSRTAFLSLFLLSIGFVISSHYLWSSTELSTSEYQDLYSHLSVLQNVDSSTIVHLQALIALAMDDDIITHQESHSLLKELAVAKTHTAVPEGSSHTSIKRALRQWLTTSIRHS